MEKPVEDIKESECRQPCDPDSGCQECSGYWDRMVSEGLWDRERHMWTSKGWRSITRTFW